MMRQGTTGFKARTMPQKTHYELRLEADDLLVGTFVAPSQRVTDFARSYIADDVERPGGGDQEPAGAERPGEALIFVRITDEGKDERQRDHLWTYSGTDGSIEYTAQWQAERQASKEAQAAKMAEIRERIDGQAAAKLEGIKAVTREVVADLREVLRATD